jgi:hypothetical protein
MTDLLARRFEPLSNPIDDSDWLDVRRRARPPWRRIALVAVAAAVTAVAVSPAFGLGGRLISLIHGSPAPPEVRAYFAADNAMREQLFEHAAAAGDQLHDRYSRVIPDEARGVAAIQSQDGPVYLWAAPTEDGRQCWLIQEGEEKATGRPYGYSVCDGLTRSGALVPDMVWTAERPSIYVVHVRVYDDSVTSVDVQFEDAPDLILPVASGHALGTMPKGEEPRFDAVVGRDADGDVVARARLSR